jgi:ribose transport system substrate-binding protein
MTTLYATGEPALLGAVSAVTSQGRTGDVKVFGWDLTKQAIEGIDQGWVTAVIQQDPAGEGKAAVEALDKVKKGGTIDKIINVPVTIVTKDNVDKFRDMFK